MRNKWLSQREFHPFPTFRPDDMKICWADPEQGGCALVKAAVGATPVAELNLSWGRRRVEGFVPCKLGFEPCAPESSLEPEDQQKQAASRDEETQKKAARFGQMGEKEGVELDNEERGAIAG